MATTLNLAECLDAAKTVARDAGAMIRDALQQRYVAASVAPRPAAGRHPVLAMLARSAEAGMKVMVKGGVDLVTETDQKCEAAILAKLKAQFPEHTFVGEETTFADDSAGDSLACPRGPTWFVDPLDGTTNFVHAYPFVTVSIGLAVDGLPVVGVVYNPVMDEMFSAAKGLGAFLNNRRIHVSGAARVEDCMVMNNIGANRDPAFIRRTLRRVETLLGHPVQAMRNSGSAAQNMAHVASGCLDVYYEEGYGGPWDVAAGYVLVTEAGGVVTAPDGSPFELRLGKGAIMCGPPAACRDVAAVIRAADAKPASSAAGTAACRDCARLTAPLVVGAAAGTAVALRKSRCPPHVATSALVGGLVAVGAVAVASRLLGR